MIRQAKLEDLPRICDLVVAMHGESPFPLPPLDADKVIREMMKAAVYVWDTGTVGGMVALEEGEFWYSQERFVADKILYVHPDFRKSRAASELVEVAKEYARMKKLPLFMSPNNGADVERKHSFFERKGMRHLGGVYSYGV